MFSWLIDSIVGFAVDVMELLAQLFINSLGNDLTAFFSLLPNNVVELSFNIMQGLGIGIVIIVISWQLFKTFGLPIGIEAENPVQIAWKSLLSIVCIIFSWQIFNLGFTVINGGKDGGPMAAINSIENNFVVQEVFSLSDLEGVIDASVSTLAFAASAEIATVMTAIAGIMIVIILFNLIKLLLELLERYCLLGVLALTSPLGFSALCSSATGNIFRAWVRMCVGQYIMLLLNIWSVRIFIVMAGNSMANDDSFLVWLFFLLAFSKVAQRMDTYLQRLGLEVGSTGGSLLGELVAVRAVVGGLTKGGSSTNAMGGHATPSGLLNKGLHALNLSGVGSAAMNGLRTYNNAANVNPVGGPMSPVKTMAATMAAAGGPAVRQLASNIGRNNVITKGYSRIKYNAVKNAFDTMGAEGSSSIVGKAVDTVGAGALSKQVSYNIADKMMNDRSRIYNDSDSCIAAGRAIFGDTLGSYDLTNSGGPSSIENARMGNGAFKFDSPSTGESVTVMKSSRVPEQVKNNALSMRKQGEYSIITQPMHSGGNGPTVSVSNDPPPGQPVTSAVNSSVSHQTTGGPSSMQSTQTVNHATVNTNDSHTASNSNVQQHVNNATSNFKRPTNNSNPTPNPQQPANNPVPKSPSK